MNTQLLDNAQNKPRTRTSKLKLATAEQYARATPAQRELLLNRGQHRLPLETDPSAKLATSVRLALGIAPPAEETRGERQPLTRRERRELSLPSVGAATPVRVPASTRFQTSAPGYAASMRSPRQNALSNPTIGRVSNIGLKSPFATGPISFFARAYRRLWSGVCGGQSWLALSKAGSHLESQIEAAKKAFVAQREEKARKAAWAADMLQRNAEVAAKLDAISTPAQ